MRCDSSVHQIRFQPGLCPRPHSGSLQRSPRHPSWISGGATSNEREEKGRKKRERGRKKGRRGENLSFYVPQPWREIDAYGSPLTPWHYRHFRVDKTGQFYCANRLLLVFNSRHRRVRLCIHVCRCLLRCILCIRRIRL